MENELRLMISWFEKKVDEAEKNYKEKHKENLDIQKMNMHVNRKLKREIRIMNAVNIIPSALIIPAVKMEKKSLNKNLHKANANEIWLYFQSVINWVKATFPNYRKEMKGIDYGSLYNKYKGKEFDSKKIEKEIKELMQDEDVTKKSGIYHYVITRNEKYLNIRSFTDKMKREAYERQEGICPKCKSPYWNKPRKSNKTAK